MHSARMASAVLTPLVTRLLRSFIRSSEGSDASSLKVSFSSRGTLLLQHLELNLDSLVPGLNVRRARAGALEITIPWTSLASQPIQVVLTGVDIELGPPDLDQKRSPSEPAGTAPPASTTSWLSGALQSWLLRTMCNLTITLKHVSVRWADASGACLAHCAFQSLELFTDDIPASMEVGAVRINCLNLGVGASRSGCMPAGLLVVHLSGGGFCVLSNSKIVDTLHNNCWRIKSITTGPS